MALAFAILLVKATLGTKYPESICFWFSFSKNRTQSSRPSAGKSCPSSPFPTAQWPLLPRATQAPTLFSPEKAKALQSFWWGIFNIKAAQLPVEALRGIKGDDLETQLLKERRQMNCHYYIKCEFSEMFNKTKSSPFFGTVFSFPSTVNYFC